MTTELVGESLESESEETIPSYDTFLRNTNRYIVINCQLDILMLIHICIGYLILSLS